MPPFKLNSTMIHFIKDSKGNEYPIAFTQAVISLLAVEEGIGVNQMGKFTQDLSKMKLETSFRFYYLAIKTASIEIGKDFDMDMTRFIMLCSNDEVFMPNILKVIEASNPVTEKKTGLKQAMKRGR